MNHKLWVLIATGLFIIGLGTGIILGLTRPPDLVPLLSEEIAALEELAKIFVPFQFTTAAFILLKNVSALLVSFILSPIFCLAPILSLLVNGVIISFISVIVAEEMSLGYVLAGLLPHGVFELPAIIIGEAAALNFGFMIMLALVFKERRKSLPANLKKSLSFLVLAFILLVPASIIETFVTPLLLV